MVPLKTMKVRIQCLASNQRTDIITSLVLDALSALTTEDKPIDPFATPNQLDGDLITLTLLPRSRWQTLLNLEVIQVCLLHPHSALHVLKTCL